MDRKEHALRKQCQQSYKMLKVRKLEQLCLTWQIDQLGFYFLEMENEQCRFRALSMLHGVERFINMYFILDTGDGVSTVFMTLTYPNTPVYLKPNQGEVLQQLVKWVHKPAEVLWRQYKLNNLLGSE